MNRAVKRQLKALTSGPPPRRRMPWGRQHVFSAGLALALAVVVAMAVDGATRWLLLG